jgi:hypothetical protein
MLVSFERPAHSAAAIERAWWLRRFSATLENRIAATVSHIDKRG